MREETGHRLRVSRGVDKSPDGGQNLRLDRLMSGALARWVQDRLPPLCDTLSAAPAEVRQVAMGIAERASERWGKEIARIVSRRRNQG
jgi:hypothetical protein